MKAIGKIFIIHKPSGDILLLRRSKTAPRRPLTWDLPGGMLENGEEPSISILREVAEETGIKLQLTNKFYEYQDKTSSDEDIQRYFYVSKVNTKEVCLSYEHDMYKWASVKEFARLVKYDPFLKAFKEIGK